MKENRTKILAQAGIFLALSAVLEFGTAFIPQMPQGGKFISLGMIPVIAFGLMYGWRWGSFLGVALGMLQFIFDRFPPFHPVQFILDYPLAFGMLGLAGLFKPDKAWKIIAGVFAASFGRLFIHFISGVVFFRAYVPQGVNPYIYSLLYNASYIIPSAITGAILLPLIMKKLIKPDNR